LNVACTNAYNACHASVTKRTNGIEPCYTRCLTQRLVTASYRFEETP